LEEKGSKQKSEGGKRLERKGKGKPMLKGCGQNGRNRGRKAGKGLDEREKEDRA
jgi:hypothetical protein